MTDILGKFAEKRDQALASLVSEIMSSDLFAVTLEKFIDAGGFLDSKIQSTLNTFRVASKREVEDLEERIIRLERKLSRTITLLEEMKERMDNRGKKVTTTEQRMEGVCANCGKSFTKKTVNQRFYAPDAGVSFKIPRRRDAQPISP